MRHDLRTALALPSFHFFVLFPCEDFTNAAAILLSFFVPNITTMNIQINSRMLHKQVNIYDDYLVLLWKRSNFFVNFTLYEENKLGIVGRM
jgi:hypothetical protein